MEKCIGIIKQDQAPSAETPRAENRGPASQSDITLGDGEAAPDIHLEPGASRYRIRLRIDGVLHILQDIAKETGLALTAD